MRIGYNPTLTKVLLSDLTSRGEDSDLAVCLIFIHMS